MKRRIILLTALLLLPLTASANSSWIWLSETRPYDVLPFVAVITIVIETAALWLVLEKQHLRKIAVIVVIANLLSFAAPYLFLYDETIRMPLKPFPELMAYGYYYTVGAVFLITTLIIELPVTCLFLRKHVQKKGRLWLTALGANVVTTLITAAAERVFCYGHW